MSDDPIVSYMQGRGGLSIGARSAFDPLAVNAMSDLTAQLSAFKNRIKSGNLVLVARKATKPVLPTKQPPAAPVKRPGDSINEAIKRQKTLNQGTHLLTQLHMAVECIKGQDKPVPVAELQQQLLFDVTNLLPLLREIDRIRYNPEKQTLQYVSLHNIRNLDDLLNYLRLQPTFKGVKVADLKDGWSGCMQAIAQLEAENRILVLRNKKENAPRLIWANLGGQLDMIDPEFKDMWGAVKVPEGDNLYQALIDQLLKPTGADPTLVKKQVKKEEKKQKKARRGKITNTHMKGILKDYSQMV